MCARLRHVIAQAHIPHGPLTYASAAQCSGDTAGGGRPAYLGLRVARVRAPPQRRLGNAVRQVPGVQGDRFLLQDDPEVPMGHGDALGVVDQEHGVVDAEEGVFGVPQEGPVEVVHPKADEVL